MRKLMSLITASLALGVVVPAAASAQSRGRDHDRDRGRVTAGDVVRRKDDGNDRDRDRNVRIVRRDGRRDDDRDSDRDSDRKRRNDDWDRMRRGNGKGPAFCRSGSGHPVYGRQWCVNKGFGLGSNSRWDRVTWNDVIFRRRPRTNYQFGRDVLYGMLGAPVYNRLDTQRRYWGVSAPLMGRWDYDEGRSVLLVNAGGIPIAELVDLNGDNRVDYVLMNRR